MLCLCSSHADETLSTASLIVSDTGKNWIDDHSTSSPVFSSTLHTRPMYTSMPYAHPYPCPSHVERGVGAWCILHIQPMPQAVSSLPPQQGQTKNRKRKKRAWKKGKSHQLYSAMYLTPHFQRPASPSASGRWLDKVYAATYTYVHTYILACSCGHSRPLLLSSDHRLGERQAACSMHIWHREERDTDGDRVSRRVQTKAWHNTENITDYEWMRGCKSLLHFRSSGSSSAMLHLGRDKRAISLTDWKSPPWPEGLFIYEASIHRDQLQLRFTQYNAL